jgi:hypothetical protein
MSRMIMSIAPALAAGAAAAVFAVAPPASAGPEQCANATDQTVCQSPGNSSITVNPPQTGAGGFGGGANEQNGNYGPSGNTPPVGN